MRPSFPRTLRLILAAICLNCAFPVDTFAADETAPAETAVAKDTERYEYRDVHDRNGIGKFYLGREIARVMSFHGAPWLERAEREQEEKLSLLLKSLELKPGDKVVDVGSGSGVITIPMARLVGPKGEVYAVDIQQEMLDLLAAKLNRLNLTNVNLVLGEVDDPKLPTGKIDLALMVDVYHELEFPYEMMLNLSKAMAPGGRIVLVEYRLEDPEVPIKLVHKMSEKQVIKEMTVPELGMRHKKTISALPRQHVVIFEKPADDATGE